MGERATIEIVDEMGEHSPAHIYVHWHGEHEQVCQFVKEASTKMRKCSAEYAAARLVAHICNSIDNNSDARCRLVCNSQAITNKRPLC